MTDFTKYDEQSDSSDSSWKAVLTLVGEQMDMNVFPAVTDGGFVVPDERPVPTTFQGTEVIEDERERSSRPAAGSRKGAKGREREAGGAACAVSSVPFRNPRSYFEGEFGKVVKSYPGTQVWVQEAGAFLKMPADLLPGLERRVIFAIAIRFSSAPEIRAWAFWEDGTWLGPRHTNAPDGSICAFDASCPTWQVGQTLVQLVDIYVVWALRHLHLEVLGRWPGRQLIKDPFERLSEALPDELCGCDSRNGKRYSVCCLPSDKKRFFAQVSRTGVTRVLPHRAAPSDIATFVNDNREPPEIAKNTVDS